MTTPAKPVVPETVTVAIPTNPTVKMSTREIAVTIGKRHDHVMCDVKLLIEQDALRAPNFGETFFEAKMPNGARPRKVPMYLLDFQGTMTLVTGYNAVLRSKVIARWMELDFGIVYKARFLTDAAKRICTLELVHTALDRHFRRSSLSNQVDMQATQRVLQLLGVKVLYGQKNRRAGCAGDNLVV